LFFSSKDLLDDSSSSFLSSEDLLLVSFSSFLSSKALWSASFSSLSSFFSSLSFSLSLPFDDSLEWLSSDSFDFTLHLKAEESTLLLLRFGDFEADLDEAAERDLVILWLSGGFDIFLDDVELRFGAFNTVRHSVREADGVALVMFSMWKSAVTKVISSSACWSGSNSICLGMDTFAFAK
jgi:hypothetical protein